MSCLFICKLPGLSCNDTAAASWTIGARKTDPLFLAEGRYTMPDHSVLWRVTRRAAPAAGSQGRARAAGAGPAACCPVWASIRRVA